MLFKKTRDAIRQPKTEKSHIDMPFLILVLVLLGFGLVMVCSASYVSALYKYNDSFYFIKRQAIWAVFAIVVMLLIVALIKPKTIRRFMVPLMIVALIMVLLVLIPGIGIKVNGARRWLGVGPVRIQPSEVAKVAVIVYLANYLTVNQNKIKKFKEGMLPAIIVMMVYTALVAVETHISGAILIAGVGFVMLFVGGGSIKAFLMMALAGGGAFGFMIAFTDYAKVRVQTWLNPFIDTTGDGFQTVQSLYAIGSGGLFGLGLGQSRQKHLYIPEPQNDYIFAIVCEELGFIGAIVVILLFCMLIWRGFVIAFKIPDRFASFLVIGVTSHLALQTILNIAVVTNAIPCTGIGLPFFSYGGTALVMLMAEVGIVLSCSKLIPPEHIDS